MKISGKDVIIYFRIQDSPEQLEPAGCSRTCTLTTNSVVAPCSTVGSGIWQEFKSLAIGWTMSVQGLCTFDENVDLQTLRTIQYTLEPIYVTFVETSGATTVTYAGYGILTSVQSSGSYNDVENYDIQIQGTSELITT